MEKKSFKERERERREAEILHTAGQIIRQHGYAHLSMDGLAEAVGISKPTLYQHFKNKEDLIAQSVIKTAREMQDFILAQQSGTPLQKLEALLRFMIESMQNPDAFPMALVTSEVMKVLAQHPDLRMPMQVVQGTLYSWVEEGKATGEIHPDLPSVVVVGALFSLMTVAEPSGEYRVDTVPPDVITNAILHLFRHGVSVR
jgi:AcrR family transcriptional regulator